MVEVWWSQASLLFLSRKQTPHTSTAVAMTTTGPAWTCPGDLHVRVNPSRHPSHRVQHTETLTRGQAALGADVELHLQVQVAAVSLRPLLLHLRQQQRFLLLQDREELQEDRKQRRPTAPSGLQPGGEPELHGWNPRPEAATSSPPDQTSAHL